MTPRRRSELSTSRRESIDWIQTEANKSEYAGAISSTSLKQTDGGSETLNWGLPEPAARPTSRAPA
jgi:hypothetical protein